MWLYGKNHFCDVQVSLIFLLNSVMQVLRLLGFMLVKISVLVKEFVVVLLVVHIIIVLRKMVMKRIINNMYFLQAYLWQCQHYQHSSSGF